MPLTLVLLHYVTILYVPVCVYMICTIGVRVCRPEHAVDIVKGVEVHTNEGGKVSKLWRKGCARCNPPTDACAQTCSTALVRNAKIWLASQKLSIEMVSDFFLSLYTWVLSSKSSSKKNSNWILVMLHVSGTAGPVLHACCAC